MVGTDFLSDNSKEILAVVATSVLGFLSFAYEQPIILSLFLFSTVVIILRFFKFVDFKEDFTILFFALTLSLVIPAISRSMPDRSQYVLIFTSLVIPFYIFTSKIGGLIFSRGLNYLVKESKSKAKIIKGAETDFKQIFVTISLMMSFVASIIAIIFAKDLFFVSMNGSKDLLTLVGDIISNVILSPHFLGPTFGLAGLIILLFLIKNRKIFNHFKRLKTGLFLFANTVGAFVIPLVFSILVTVAFFALHGLYIQTSMEADFRVCQFDNTTYIMSHINRFDSICNIRVFYEDAPNNAIQYSVFLPEDKSVDEFYIDETNRTVKYAAICSSFIGFIKNVPTC